MISLFAYDNDTFVLYPYVDRETCDSDILVHIKDAKSIERIDMPRPIEPLYYDKDYAVFSLRTTVGKFAGYKINR